MMELLKTQLNQTVILIKQGDIILEDTDAIVNAANEALQHGGGLAGAIVRRGGRIIQEESNAIGRVATGSAAATSAGSLSAKSVIHAVGPIWGTGNEADKLKRAVQSALSIADSKSYSSISIPAISSGIFGCPKPFCAEVILKAIKDYIASSPNTLLKEIRIVLMDNATSDAFAKAFMDIFSVNQC